VKTGGSVLSNEQTEAQASGKLDQLQLVPFGGDIGPKTDQPGTPDFLSYIRDPHNQNPNMTELVS
jgi:hypothetical protein